MQLGKRDLKSGAALGLAMVATLAIGQFAAADPVAAQEISQCEVGQQIGGPVARHEAGFVRLGDKLYLLGGRGIRYVSIFDPATGEWSQGSKVPLELHHFQPVVVGDEIWIVGAMTGAWPTEPPVRHVWRYIPDQDRFERGIALPEDRLRGGGGVVNLDGKLWWAGGIEFGHTSGTVGWLDSYDLETQTWARHPDMQFPRDHWQMVAKDGRLYVAGGRETGHDADDYFEPTIIQGEIYDIALGDWMPLDERFQIPTPRAGLAATVVGDRILYAGGESAAQQLAHAEIEAYDITTGEWQTVAMMAEGRHGTGLPLFGDRLYIASGSGRQGGAPELTTMECLTVSFDEQG